MIHKLKLNKETYSKKEVAEIVKQVIHNLECQCTEEQNGKKEN